MKQRENEQIITTFATTFAALFAMMIIRMHNLQIFSFYGMTQYIIVLAIISCQGYIAGCKADYNYRERFGQRTRPDQRYVSILVKVVRWEVFVFVVFWMATHTIWSYVFVSALWGFGSGFLINDYRNLLKK